MKQKILILGGNGLVGKSLTRILNESRKDNEVFASSRKDADLFSFTETKKLIESFKPNVLVNAAAKVGGIYANNTSRSEFLIENLKININMLESCIEHPEIRIINLGSSCIYPLDADDPIKESSFMEGKLEPTNSPYAMAKLTAIELGKSLSKQYGHRVTNLMPTNLYGPNDNFNHESSHVIPGLIARMHEAKINNYESFKIWGSGKPLREFLYVDDLSRAINFLIEENIDIDLINIGSGEEISIFDLAQKIKEIIKYSGNLTFDDTKPDGNPRKFLDSSKIHQLGWKPDIKLNSGLNLTYDWFIKNN